MLQRVVVRPLKRLAADTREVSRGAFGRDLHATGAREVQDLGDDVDAMRRRIVDEIVLLQEAEEELVRQAQELQRSNTELEQFAYVASHDLQEPLRKVATFCQMLQQRYAGQLDERADQYIEFAVDGAKRMQALINDLLAFSRVGRLTQPQDAVDTAELVARAERSLASAIEETGAEVVYGSLPTVRGDATLLSLVFQNLIGNAIKFRTDAPPRVEITAERDDGEWRFRCADNGIGIDAEYAERIFIIFQRLHARTAYAGTGIGLAMCRKIIEYHGGRIWLDGETAEGSAFLFTLPAEEALPDDNP
jgi:light-regulated signal transduction histidine kinase (bacteriophytochrome)